MFLGIDVGTSAAKAILLRGDGSIAGVGGCAYPIARPHEGWSEQHPRDWWAGAIAATRAACAGLEPDAVKAIGLTGQMHGLVLIGADGLREAGRGVIEPLRPAILWNDQRTSKECEAIEHLLGGRAACVRATGNAALPGFTLPKVLWMRGNEPEVWAQVERMLLPKDYLRMVMTAESATDVGDASGLLLLDPKTRKWSDTMTGKFDIDLRTLPTLRECANNTGDLTVWAARELGLARSTPVFAGSGDNQTAALGAGVTSPGEAMLSLGTSGVLYTHTDRPLLDLGDPPGRVHTFCAADGANGIAGGWCNTACLLAAGGSLAWAAEVIGGGAAMEALLAEAASVPPGCDGLMFLPHLTGERCPHPDSFARGGWVGLTSRHTRGHLIRAVLEGVAFSHAQNLELLCSLGGSTTELSVVGGGAKSALWLEIHAASLGVPLTTLDADEGPALGAAMLAGVGDGAWSSVREAAAACVRPKHTIRPDAGLARAYSNVTPRHRGVYPLLRSHFRSQSE